MAVDDSRFEYIPSFFKIIFESASLQKLALPIKFMSDYGGDLSDVVILKIPTGKTWKVELLKEQGRAWLRNGWPEFVSDYSIRHGQFLVFRYGGKSVFNVSIFDTTACEIVYPLDVPEETRDIQENRSVRKPNTRSSNKSVPSASAKENGMVALVNQYTRKFGGSLTRKHFEEINSNRFEYPCFAAKMRPSAVEYDFGLHVPSNFASMYLRKIGGSFILQNESGDTWAIKCVGKSPLMKFRGGWKHFALDNKLRVDDICVFELIKVVNGTHLFKVEMIRSSSAVGTVPSGSKSSLDATIEVITIDD